MNLEHEVQQEGKPGYLTGHKICASEFPCVNVKHLICEGDQHGTEIKFHHILVVSVNTEGDTGAAMCDILAWRAELPNDEFVCDKDKPEKLGRKKPFMFMDREVVLSYFLPFAQHRLYCSIIYIFFRDFYKLSSAMNIQSVIYTMDHLDWVTSLRTMTQMKLDLVRVLSTSCVYFAIWGMVMVVTPSNTVGLESLAVKVIGVRGMLLTPSSASTWNMVSLFDFCHI
jgi:hypothetical protein